MRLQSKIESSNTKAFEKLKLLNKKIDKIEADSLGLTYLTRLQVGSSHLRKHKFRHNFLDSQTQFATSAMLLNQVSTTFFTARISFLQNARIVNPNLLFMNEDTLTHLLLYDDYTLTDNTNTFLLISFIKDIPLTKHFNDPLIL